MFKDSSIGLKRSAKDSKLSKRLVVDKLLPRKRTHGASLMLTKDFNMLSLKVLTNTLMRTLKKPEKIILDLLMLSRDHSWQVCQLLAIISEVAKCSYHKSSSQLAS